MPDRPSADLAAIEPVYGPGYPRWAAEHEQDATRRDLARGLLSAEARCEQAEREAARAWCFEHKMMQRAVEAEERLEAAERRVAELEAALRRLEQALDSMLWDGQPFTDWSANVDSARQAARAALEGSDGTAAHTCTTPGVPHNSPLIEDDFQRAARAISMLLEEIAVVKHQATSEHGSDSDQARMWMRHERLLVSARQTLYEANDDLNRHAEHLKQTSDIREQE